MFQSGSKRFFLKTKQSPHHFPFFLQQSVLRKVNPQDALQIANPIMTALLQMLSVGTGAGGGGVQEDALMAIGTLVEGTLLSCAVVRALASHQCGPGSIPGSRFSSLLQEVLLCVLGFSPLLKNQHF